MKNIGIVILLLVGSTAVIAQNVSIKEEKIKGVVLNNDGQPLSGVAVTNQNNQKTSTTDIKGFYSIDGKKGNMLVFSHKDMVSQRVTIGDKTNIDLSLRANRYPLIIVDGVPIKKRVNVNAPNFNLSTIGINVNDVLSIMGLKKGKATATYGKKASDGAMIITTKKGNKKK